MWFNREFQLQISGDKFWGWYNKEGVQWLLCSE